MTIKNITLSAIAATMVTTVAFAGTISTSGASKIGEEQLSLTNIDVSNITGQAKVTYTPTSIPAGSLKNPIFKFTLTNAKSFVDKSPNGLGVFEVKDGNESNTSANDYTLVANTATVSGSNNEVVSFNAATASTYVYNNKKYVIRDLNSTGDGAATVATDENLTATVTKGSTSAVQLAAALYSGDSQALNDSATNATLYTIAKEYSASITKELDARIDASNSFFTFYDNYSDSFKKADDLQAKLVQGTGFITGGTLTVATQNLIVYPDQNLTKNGLSVSAANGTVVAAAYDKNITINTIAANTATDVNLTVNGSTKIEKTQFGAEMYITTTSPATGKFQLITKGTANAGKWVIYGYNAQIPNVAATSDVDVTMKFTNRSSLNTDIYFTLIDRDGTIVDLNSVNTTLASLPANATGTYKASDLLALVTDTNFDKTGSFSVEVSIPTTPTSVYGMASFKNLTLGQFKDLPVYNSSTMSY